MNCQCCQTPIKAGEARDVNEVWDGRLNGYCIACATNRCDAYPGECPVGDESNPLSSPEMIDWFACQARSIDALTEYFMELVPGGTKEGCEPLARGALAKLAQSEITVEWNR